MALSVASAFTAFADQIKPTATEESQITSRRGSVETFLFKEYPADAAMPLTQVRVIGSAGRKTLIRPVNDLDVFAVFDDSQVWSSYQHDSKQLLYRVREALAGYRVETVGSRGQAVRLFYASGPHVDITPAFPVINFLGGQTGFYIPSGNGGWTQTDPYLHGDFMASRNQAMGGYLKPLVRSLKAWNDAHSKRLSGFHLEIMTQAVFSSVGPNLREATLLFFQNAASYLDVEDPAGFSGSLTGGWSYQKRQEVTQSFLQAESRARSALESEAAADHAEAIRHWSILFGNHFPSYG